MTVSLQDRSDRGSVFFGREQDELYQCPNQNEHQNGFYRGADLVADKAEHYRGGEADVCRFYAAFHVATPEDMVTSIVHV